MKVLNHLLIGVAISAFCMIIASTSNQVWFSYWQVGLTFIMGALQGLAVYIMYSRLEIAFLYRVLIHMAISYLLALGIAVLFVPKWSMTPLGSFTFSWLVIYVVLYSYFYLLNHRKAREINQKIENRRKKEDEKFTH